MKSLQAMPAAGFRERAGYHRTRTTRCPRMGAVRVPGSTRHQDARMSLVFVSGSDWPPAPARFNASRGGLCAASICNQFVAAQVEETEPRSAAGLWPGCRDPVDAGEGSRAAETRAACENWLRRAQVHLGPSQRTQRLRGCAERHRSIRVHEERDKAGPTFSARTGDSRGGCPVLVSGS